MKRFCVALKAYCGVLMCFLFAGCEESGLRDYINDHVVTAKLNKVEGAEMAGWSLMKVPIDESKLDSLFQLWPSGLLVIRQADERQTLGLPEETVLKVVLDNSRKTLYTVTCSGKHSAYVENVVQDPADPGSIYVALKGDLPPGPLDVRLHLKPPPAVAPPDDIVLPIACSGFGGSGSGGNSGNSSSFVMIVENGLGGSLTVGFDKDGMLVPQGGQLLFHANDTSLSGANWSVSLDRTSLAPPLMMPPSSVNGFSTAVFTLGVVETGKREATVTIEKNGSLYYTGSFSITVYPDLSAWTVTGLSSSSAAILKTGVAEGTAYDTLENAINTAAGGTESDPKTIILLKNSEIGAVNITSNKHIRLIALHGETKVIRRHSSFSGKMFSVSSGASLALCGKGSGEIVLDGQGITYSQGVFVGGGKFIMHGGAIVNNKAITPGNGGGVYVDNGGKFTMSGGMIAENYAQKGSGIFINSGGEALITGGTIRNNGTSGGTSEYGGGVYIANDGSLTMTSGMISANLATVNGGGIYVEGTTGSFIMSGGTISGNWAPYGGGITIAASVTAKGRAVISGGTISGNRAASHGGGINVNGTLMMTGGTITGNSVESSLDNWGGGVAVRASTDNAVFEMQGGIITKNGKASVTRGGGIAIVAETSRSATFTFSGGIIENDNKGESGYSSLYAHRGGSSNKGTVTAQYGDGTVVIAQGNGTDDRLTGR